MEGKYQAYPVYDQSGVEWLGKVPAHWRIKPLKYLTNFINGNAFKPSEWSESGTPIIRIENLNGGESFNFYEGAVSDRYRVNKGDLLFGWSGNKGTSFGPFIWWRDGQHYLNQHIYRLEGFNCHKRWFYWILKAATYYIEEQAHGIIGMIHVTKAKLGGICIPSITDEEQRTIAAFLDHETARIDKLIEKQQRLIELLKEKRQAVISHAVTKGLDPNVPMKDSGVEWLGQVPEHWKVVRLKHCIKDGTSISYGIVQPGEPLDEGVPFIQTTNMSTGSFEVGKLQRTTAEIAAAYPRSRLAGGEVILGIRASIGAAYVVPDWLTGVNLSRGVARIVPNHKLSAEYLVWALRTEQTSQYWGLAKQGSTFSEVSIETVKELPLPIPPNREQIEIVIKLANELEKLDLLSAKLNQKKELLKERRTALISAAVTGKIDLRGWSADA